MRIAFLGTPDFAIPSFQMLIDQGHTLALFTNPDRPKGRHGDLTPPPTKVLAQKYGATMTQVSLAWHFAKGVAAPIIGATKAKYLDDAAGAFGVALTEEDVAYIDEPYQPHRIVGAL